MQEAYNLEPTNEHFIGAVRELQRQCNQPKEGSEEEADAASDASAKASPAGPTPAGQAENDPGAAEPAASGSADTAGQSPPAAPPAQTQAQASAPPQQRQHGITVRLRNLQTDEGDDEEEALYA